jgi:hypothetical protein
MNATEATDITLRNRQIEAEAKARSTSKMADGIIQQVEKGIREGGHPALRAYGSYMYDAAVRAEVDRRLTGAGFTISTGSAHDVDWPGKYDTFSRKP